MPALLVLVLGACGPAGRLVAPSPAAPPAAVTAGISAPPAEVPPPPAVDLATCLAVAVHDNRALQRQRHATERSSLGRRIALREVLDPRLNASYTHQEGDDIGDSRVDADLRWAGFTVTPFVEVDYDEEEAAGSGRYDSSVGLVLERQLLRIHDGVRQRLPLDRAERDWLKARNELALRWRVLGFEVASSFYEVQKSQSRIRIREASVRSAAEFLASLEPLVPRVVAPIELTNARIELNRASTELLREQTRLAAAREALADLLGLPVDAPPEIRPEDVSVWPGVALDLEADLRHMLAAHERVRDLVLDLAFQERESLVAREAMLPELSGTLTLRHRREGDSAFDDRYLADDEVLLGVSLTLPLDNWAAERARHRQALLRGEELVLQLAETRADLERQLRQQYRRVAELEQQVQLAEERFGAEQDKLASTLQRYADGQIDNLEVTRAKEAAEAADLALLEARIERILAVARYRSLVPAP